MSEKCSNLDRFCFICGHYIDPLGLKRTITATIQTAYVGCFGILAEETPYSPSYCCQSCYSALIRVNSGLSMTFVLKTPMKWLPARNHPHDCYACCVRVSDSGIVYPNDSSSEKPIVNEDSKSSRKSFFM